MNWIDRISRAGRTMLAIVAVAFVSEVVVMLVVGRWANIAGLGRLALVDAMALAVVIAPPVYFLVLRPLRQEGERRLAAERRARRADRLALTDPLTQVLNRRGIKASLLEAMARAERYERPLSLAMLDLDGFKRVNDQYGHAFGDEVLSRTARVASEALREPDHFGRYGGDEFLLVLPETRLESARALTDRIAEALGRALIEVEGRALALSATFGEVEFVHGESLRELLERVDRALYVAKGTRPALARRAAAAGRAEPPAAR